MPPRKPLPRDDHVVRYASWAKLRKDENDNVVGLLFATFKPRPNEGDLSATWMEYFRGTREEQLTSAIRAIRNSKVDVKPKGGFAIGQVQSIIRTCANRKRSVRIVYDRRDDNEAHSSVRPWPADDNDLFEDLANGGVGRVEIEQGGTGLSKPLAREGIVEQATGQRLLLRPSRLTGPRSTPS